MKKTVKYQKGGPVKKMQTGGTKGAKSVISTGIKKADISAGNKAISTLNNQGKPGSNKKLNQGSAYDSKGRVVEKYNVNGSNPKVYESHSGTVTRYDADKKSNNSSQSFLDTTGFAKGKKTFEKTTLSGAAGKKGTVTKTTVKRAAIPSTIKKMQSFKKK
jgi:hypothetical protein